MAWQSKAQQEHFGICSLRGVFPEADAGPHCQIPGHAALSQQSPCRVSGCCARIGTVYCRAGQESPAGRLPGLYGFGHICPDPCGHGSGNGLVGKHPVHNPDILGFFRVFGHGDRDGPVLWFPFCGKFRFPLFVCFDFGVLETMAHFIGSMVPRILVYSFGGQQEGECLFQPVCRFLGYRLVAWLHVALHLVGDMPWLVRDDGKILDEKGLVREDSRACPLALRDVRGQSRLGGFPGFRLGRFCGIPETDAGHRLRCISPDLFFLLFPYPPCACFVRGQHCIDGGAGEQEGAGTVAGME